MLLPTLSLNTESMLMISHLQKTLEVMIRVIYKMIPDLQHFSDWASNNGLNLNAKTEMPSSWGQI